MGHWPAASADVVRASCPTTPRSPRLVSPFYAAGCRRPCHYFRLQRGRHAEDWRSSKLHWGRQISPWCVVRRLLFTSTWNVDQELSHPDTISLARQADWQLTRCYVELVRGVLSSCWDSCWYPPLAVTANPCYCRPCRASIRTRSTYSSIIRPNTNTLFGPVFGPNRIQPYFSLSVRFPTSMGDSCSIDIHCLSLCTSHAKIFETNSYRAMVTIKPGFLI